MKSITESGTSRRKNWLFIGWLLLGIAIGFVVITVINFQNQLLNQLSERLPSSLNLLPTGVFDGTHISALKQISGLLPHNEIIVVSDNAPVFEYFTKLEAKAPRDAYSEKSLISYMTENGYNYLVVYEGNSQVQALSELFSSDGLKELNEDFNEIANYATESNNIHVYQRKI